MTNLKQHKNIDKDAATSTVNDSSLESATFNGTSNTNPRPAPTALKWLRFAFGVGGHIAPGLAGQKAYELWFKPTRFQTPSTEQSALDSADIEHHDFNGHDIATYSWGKSEDTVLLVHGWSGRGTQLGSFVEPLVKAGYRVISFDAPAHGKSSGKHTNLYEVADVLLDLQKHYGAFDSVITHSFGGPCVAVALQRGFKASCVISISPPATTKGLVEKFIHTLNVPKKAGDHMMARIETVFGKKIWHEISMKNTVRDLTIPAMIIHDHHDVDIPWQEGKSIAQAWSNSHFIKTTGLGHRRILRDPTVIKSAVKFITTTT